MYTLIRPVLFAVALATASAGGVAAALAQPAPVPPLKLEGARPPPPGASHVWRPGHWDWADGGYRWVGGQWVLREPGWRRGVFVSGHWGHHGAEWVWIPGNFR